MTDIDTQLGSVIPEDEEVEELPEVEDGFEVDDDADDDDDDPDLGEEV